MFNRDLKVYLYPYQKQKEGELTNSKNLQIHPRFRPLYEYLTYNNRIVDVDYDPKVLHIFSPIVLRMIKNGYNFAKKNDIRNVSFINADIFDDVFEEKVFDFVWCSGVLHHTKDPYGGFEIIQKSLKSKKLHRHPYFCGFLSTG